MSREGGEIPSPVQSEAVEGNHSQRPTFMERLRTKVVHGIGSAFELMGREEAGNPLSTRLPTKESLSEAKESGKP